MWVPSGSNGGVPDPPAKNQILSAKQVISLVCTIIIFQGHATNLYTASYSKKARRARASTPTLYLSAKANRSLGQLPSDSHATSTFSPSCVYIIWLLAYPGITAADTMSRGSDTSDMK